MWNPVCYEISKVRFRIFDTWLTFDKESKYISVDILANAMNSFTYVKMLRFLKVLRYVRLRICYSDPKFENRGAEYEKYLIARDYEPDKVKKQFSDAREESSRPKPESNFSTLFNLITQYNQMFLNIKISSKTLLKLYQN